MNLKARLARLEAPVPSLTGESRVYTLEEIRSLGCHELLELYRQTFQNSPAEVERLIRLYHEA